MPVVSGNPSKIITTVDKLDRLFLKNKNVQDNYFDKKLLDILLNKYKINKND